MKKTDLAMGLLEAAKALEKIESEKADAACADSGRMPVLRADAGIASGAADAGAAGEDVVPGNAKTENTAADETDTSADKPKKKVKAKPKPSQAQKLNAQRRKEKAEVRRLMQVYSGMEQNALKVAEGLIVEAARLRVRLDYLWADLQEHGETEMFSQSDRTEPYERERPQSRNYTNTNKAYQAIIKQLADMCPPAEEENPFAEFE